MIIRTLQYAKAITTTMSWEEPYPTCPEGHELESRSFRYGTCEMRIYTWQCDECKEWHEDDKFASYDDSYPLNWYCREWSGKKEEIPCHYDICEVRLGAGMLVYIELLMMNVSRSVSPSVMRRPKECLRNARSWHQPGE
jgi:hypothetical protein